MRTSRAALREAVESGALKAWMRDEKIQSRRDGEAEWVEWEDRTGGNNPAFGNPDLFWRQAPEKKRVPFCRDTVPKHALWSHPNGCEWMVATGYGIGGLLFGKASVTYVELANEGYKFSQNGGLTWHPASQEVES